MSRTNRGMQVLGSSIERGAEGATRPIGGLGRGRGIKAKRIGLGLLLVLVAVPLSTACMPIGASQPDESPTQQLYGVPRPTVAVFGDRGRSTGELSETSTPYATWVPLSLVTPTPTADPTSPAAPSVTADEMVADNGVADVAAEDDAVPTATPAQQPVVAGAVSGDSFSVANDAVLSRLDDVDPGPPFTILVDTVRLVDGGMTYKIAGWIRNDGDESYESIGLEATFYDADPWHYGPFAAACGCYALAPGQSCPFAVEAYARDYAGYRLHAEGHPLKAWTGGATPLVVERVSVVGSVGGYVHLTGIVRNQTSATTGVARVSAALLDGTGAVTGVGSTVLLRRLPPGAEMVFDLRVAADEYSDYLVLAEAK